MKYLVPIPVAAQFKRRTPARMEGSASVTSRMCVRSCLLTPHSHRYSHPVLDHLSWASLMYIKWLSETQEERKVEGKVKKDIHFVVLLFLPYCFFIFFQIIS
jgi:hypothetical protein